MCVCFERNLSNLITSAICLPRCVITPLFLLHNKSCTFFSILQYDSLPISTWNYDKSGADWKGTCATGKTQSPIAFKTSSTRTTSRRVNLKFGKVSQLLVYNTGYAIKVGIVDAFLPCIYYTNTMTAKFTRTHSNTNLQAEWLSIKDSKTVIPTGSMWGAAEEGISTVPVTPLQFHVHSTCEHLVNGFMCPLVCHSCCCCLRLHNDIARLLFSSLLC